MGVFIVNNTSAVEPRGSRSTTLSRPLMPLHNPTATLSLPLAAIFTLPLLLSRTSCLYFSFSYYFLFLLSWIFFIYIYTNPSLCLCVFSFFFSFFLFLFAEWFADNKRYCQCCISPLFFGWSVPGVSIYLYIST